jgi:predicted transcriptional regulator of viral defense system
MTAKPDSTRLYQLAEPQAGYFTAAQAGAAGYSRQRLAYHVRRGRLIRIAHGLYRHTLYPASPFEDLHAALLRTGKGSVISHDSALAVYGLSDLLPAEIHVTIPRTSSRRHAGLRLHTSRITPSEIAHREGLRVTTVARTVADIASSGVAAEHVIQAIDEAIQRGLAQAEEFEDQGRRRGGRAAALIGQALLKAGRA